MNLLFSLEQVTPRCTLNSWHGKRQCFKYFLIETNVHMPGQYIFDGLLRAVYHPCKDSICSIGGADTSTFDCSSLKEYGATECRIFNLDIA